MKTKIIKMKFTVIVAIFFSGIIAFTSCSTVQKSALDENHKLTQKEASQEADLFAKGVIQKEAGNFEKALDFFSKALEIDPNDPAALFEKAKLLVAYGQSSEAYELAKKAVSLDGKNRWYKAAYGKIAQQEGKYDEYVKTYEELVEQYPDDLNFLYELAYAYVFTGDYRKAAVEYDKIEEQIGVTEPLMLQKVKVYSQLDDYQSGVKEYEKLISTNPQETRYYALMAEYCAQNKMDDKAIWAYQQIEKINPNDPYVHISLADFYRKRNNYQKSFDELKLGMENKQLELQTKIKLLSTYYSGSLDEIQKKQALELSQILIRVHPDDPMAKSLYASLLYQNEEYKQARKLTAEVLSQDSLNYAVWEQLLFCDMYLNNYKDLARETDNVIDLFPNQPLPYLMNGIAYYQLKQYEKAANSLETGKEFVAGNQKLLEEFYNYLGEIYYQLKNYDACFQSYDNVLSINPANSIVLNNYAYYLSLQKKQLPKAEQMARHAVNLDPKNVNNIDTYAWVLYQQGNYEQALKWQDEALKNGGDTNGTVLEHYGKILEKLGRTKEAKEYLQKAKKYKK
jgi:tetratricopeptide (TPR) repeat protein